MEREHTEMGGPDRVLAEKAAEDRPKWEHVCSPY